MSKTASPLLLRVLIPNIQIVISTHLHVQPEAKADSIQYDIDHQTHDSCTYLDSEACISALITSTSGKNFDVRV